MITYFRFLLLSREEKMEMLPQQGTFLLNRTDSNFTVELYALSYFFVEVRYHTQNNQLVEVVAFKSIDQLQPYTQAISLSSLRIY
jgi:hypothetical protein